MSWVWREKKDGRRAPGYFLYLLGGALAVATIVFLHRRAGGPALSSRRPPPGPATEVGSITQSAAIMAPVKLPDTGPPAGARSYRLSGGPGPASTAGGATAAGPDSFDAISAALAGAEAAPDAVRAAGAPASDRPAGVSSGFAALPPAYPPEAPRAARSSPAPSPAPFEPPKLLEYRDPEADRSPAAARERASAPPLPRGTLIPVYLLTTVDTSNPAAMLQFGVGADVIFAHRRQLPFGTRLLGKWIGLPMRDRLNLAVDTVLYPNGLELPIRASAVEADETGADIRPGVAAVYVPPPRWAQVAPYVSDALTGFLGLLQSRAQQQFAVGVGGLSVQSSAPDDARGPVLQAAGQGVQDFTAARLKEIEQRFASYYLIPAGTQCWLQLDTDLDLNAARPQRADAGRRRLPLSGVPSADFPDDESSP